MKYMVLVSHGEFASGLHNALEMLAGKRDDVISVGLQNGISANVFGEMLADAIVDISKDDEIILLGDIIGGSPLTTAMQVIDQKGLLEKAIILGGMNLPLALTTVLMKDTLERELLVETVISEASGTLKQFFVETVEEEEI